MIVRHVLPAYVHDCPDIVPQKKPGIPVLSLMAMCSTLNLYITMQACSYVPS